jgi:hypothetical protein
MCAVSAVDRTTAPCLLHDSGIPCVVARHAQQVPEYSGKGLWVPVLHAKHPHGCCKPVLTTHLEYCDHFC